MVNEIELFGDKKQNFDLPQRANSVIESNSIENGVTYSTIIWDAKKVLINGLVTNEKGEISAVPVIRISIEPPLEIIAGFPVGVMVELPIGVDAKPIIGASSELPIGVDVRPIIGASSEIPIGVDVRPIIGASSEIPIGVCVRPTIGGNSELPIRIIAGHPIYFQ